MQYYQHDRVRCYQYGPTDITYGVDSAAALLTELREEREEEEQAKSVRDGAEIFEGGGGKQSPVLVLAEGLQSAELKELLRTGASKRGDFVVLKELGVSSQIMERCVSQPGGGFSAVMHELLSGGGGKGKAAAFQTEEFWLIAFDFAVCEQCAYLLGVCAYAYLETRWMKKIRTYAGPRYLDTQDISSYTHVERVLRYACEHYEATAYLDTLATNTWAPRRLVWSTQGIRSCYAMSGTDIAYPPTIFLHIVRVSAAPPAVLRSRYALSGTDRALPYALALYAVQY
eukprot:905236-Rhodomonas_salina.6